MQSSSSFCQVTVEQMAQRVAEVQPEQLQLIDVREPNEAAIASIPGFSLFPLSQAEQWAPNLPGQLDLHKETYVLCHHGMRSAQMCQWMISQGFTQVYNIAGGIDAYSIAVDSGVPRY